MQQRDKNANLSEKLSPEQIAENIKNARQMITELIFPPVQQAITAVGGIPKLKAFIDSMGPPPQGEQPGTPKEAIPPLPGLPTTPTP